MTDTMDTKTRLVKRRGGAATGAHGFFLEVIQAGEDGKLAFQHRYFLAGSMLCTYSRKAGAKRTNWTFKKFNDHDEARTNLLSSLIMLAPGKCVMNGSAPMLVELDAKDISAMEGTGTGEAPPARFLATQMMDRLAPIDDKTWQMPKAEV